MLPKLSTLLFTLLLLVCASGSAMAQPDTLKPKNPPNNACLINAIVLSEVIDTASCCTKITVIAPPNCEIKIDSFHSIPLGNNCKFLIDGDTINIAKFNFPNTIAAGDTFSFVLCPIAECPDFN